jgi:hypothetical protein
MLYGANVSRLHRGMVVRGGASLQPPELTVADALACTQVWDPVLITAQIVSVQCLFYIVLGALQFVIIGGPGARILAGSQTQRLRPLAAGILRRPACRQR